MDKIFTKNIEHESAVKHVTGKAIYTDDISEPKNLLHAVIGYSNCSKGVIKKIDYKDVLSSEGVVDIITEKDIWVRRPGSGAIPARDYYKLIGKRIKNDKKFNDFINWSDIEG